MSTAEACGGDSKAGGTIDAVVDIKIKLLREKLWQNLGDCNKRTDICVRKVRSVMLRIFIVGQKKREKKKYTLQCFLLDRHANK